MRHIKRLSCLLITVIMAITVCTVTSFAENGATEISGEYGSVTIDQDTYYYNAAGQLFYSVGGAQVKELTVIDAAQQLLKKNSIPVKLTVSAPAAEDGSITGISIDSAVLYYGFDIRIPVYYSSEAIPETVEIGPKVEFADSESCEKLTGTLIFISNGKTKNEKFSAAIWYSGDTKNDTRSDGIVSAYVLLAAVQARDIIKKGVYLPADLFIAANGQLYYEMSNSYLPLAPVMKTDSKDSNALRFSPIRVAVRISATISAGLTANDEIQQYTKR